MPRNPQPADSHSAGCLVSSISNRSENKPTSDRSPSGPHFATHTRFPETQKMASCLIRSPRFYLPVGLRTATPIGGSTVGKPTRNHTDHRRAGRTGFHHALGRPTKRRRRGAYRELLGYSGSIARIKKIKTNLKGHGFTP
jgi:hypothetical protein